MVRNLKSLTWFFVVLSPLVFALGAPTTTRIFSGQEVDADPLPPAQPYSTPSIVSSSDPSNPLLNACGLFGTSPYTVNVNSNYDLSNCFGLHPSGQAPSFTTSGCNGLDPDGSFTPSAQVASCLVSAQIPASGNNLASPPTILDLTIAGALQPQTIAQASGDPALPDSSAPLYNSNTHTISFTGASSDLDFEINALDTSNCSAQVSSTSVVVTSNIASGNGQCRIEVFAQRDPANSVAESSRLSFDLAVSALLTQPNDLAIAVPGDSVVFAGGSVTDPLSLQNQAGSGAITWSVSADSVGVCTIDPATGAITPGATPGTCEVSASIAATSQHAAHQIGPVGFPVNAYAAPTVVAGTFGAQTATHLVSFNYDVSENFAFANEQGSLSYSLVNPPSWLSIDGDGMISGVPSVNDEGGTITVQVDDGQGQTGSVLTQTFNLSVADLPSNRFAQFGAASGDYQIAAWDYNSRPAAVNISGDGPGSAAGKMAFFYTRGQNQNASGNRRNFADVSAALNATNLTDPSYDADGLVDENGNLLTVAVNGSDTAGYLVVGLGTRSPPDSNWGHALLHLEPLDTLAGGTTTVLTGVANQNLHLPNAYYGQDSDSALITFGSPAFTTDNTGVDALTITGAIPTIGDGAPAGTPRYEVAITNTVTNERLTQTIVPDGDGNYSVTFGPSTQNILDSVQYQVQVSATQGYIARTATQTVAGPTTLSNRLPTGQVTVATNYRTRYGNPAPGLPHVYGYRVGATLTANVTSIADVDGLGTFEYQWTRAGVDIAGATAQSYTLTTADANQLVGLRTWHIDALGARQEVDLASAWSASTGTRIAGSTPWDLWQNFQIGVTPQTIQRYLVSTNDAWGGGFVDGPLPVGHSCNIEVRIVPWQAASGVNTNPVAVVKPVVANPADGSFRATWLPGELEPGWTYKMAASCNNNGGNRRATDAATSLTLHHYTDEEDGDSRAFVNRKPNNLKVKLNNGPTVAYNYARVPAGGSGNITVLDPGVGLRNLSCTGDYRFRISLKDGTPDNSGDYRLRISIDNSGGSVVRGDSSTRPSWYSTNLDNSTPRGGTGFIARVQTGQHRTVVTTGSGGWTHYDFDIWMAKGVTDSEGMPITLTVEDSFAVTDPRRPGATGFRTTFYINNNATSCFDDGDWFLAEDYSPGYGSTFRGQTFPGAPSQTFPGQWF